VSQSAEGVNAMRSFHTSGRVNARLKAVGTAIVVLVASLLLLGSAQAKSQAQITGTFTDSCRDFVAHSSKDISHVVIHYGDGRVVKDETTTTPDYAIDGSAGDEIDSVSVKAGTTTELFDCEPSVINSPPTAVLESHTPPTADGEEATCNASNDPPNLFCHSDDPRTVWTQWDSGYVAWAYGHGIGDYCPTTMELSFRGTSSTDPDNDITTWSIDFGDGASASGDWATVPSEVAHTYPNYHAAPDGFWPLTVTITVTDSGGLSDSDAMTLVSFPTCTI
jgi:hypothetical protein